MSFETNERQLAINVLSYYGVCDEAGVELFLSLRVLDRYGIPSCAWQESADHFLRECGFHQRRCHRRLDEIDSEDICEAFQDFHFIARDSDVSNDEEKLLSELTSFTGHLLCSEHQTLCEERARALLPAVASWRQEYVLPNEQHQSTSRKTSPVDRPTSRLSRLFTSGSSRFRRTTKQGDENTTSPTATEWGVLPPANRRKKVKHSSAVMGVENVQRTSSQTSFRDPELRERVESRKWERRSEGCTSEEWNDKRDSERILGDLVRERSNGDRRIELELS